MQVSLPLTLAFTWIFFYLKCGMSMLMFSPQSEVGLKSRFQYCGWALWMRSWIHTHLSTLCPGCLVLQGHWFWQAGGWRPQVELKGNERKGSRNWNAVIQASKRKGIWSESIPIESGNISSAEFLILECRRDFHTNWKSNLKLVEELRLYHGIFLLIKPNLT